MSEVAVLCYHAVSPTWPAALSVTPDAFRRQMASLLGQGWRATTFTKAVLAPPARRTLAVTFDDAFLSVLEHAHPILSELRMPATVFAPTAFMERRQLLRWSGIERWQSTDHAAELQCMDWHDLRRLSSAGWEVGSHTRTHPRLPAIDEEQAVEELERSRNEVSAQLGSCEALAYPYGDADPRIATLTAAAGYRCAASLSSSLARRGAHLWPRLGIYRGDSGWRFSLKMHSGLRRARASMWWPAHE